MQRLNKKPIKIAGMGWKILGDGRYKVYKVTDFDRQVKMALLLTIHFLSRRLPTLFVMFTVSMMLFGGQARAEAIDDAVAALDAGRYQYACESFEALAQADRLDHLLDRALNGVDVTLPASDGAGFELADSVVPTVPQRIADVLLQTSGPPARQAAAQRHRPSGDARSDPAATPPGSRPVPL